LARLNRLMFYNVYGTKSEQPATRCGSIVANPGISVAAATSIS